MNSSTGSVSSIEPGCIRVRVQALKRGIECRSEADIRGAGRREHRTAAAVARIGIPGRGLIRVDAQRGQRVAHCARRILARGPAPGPARCAGRLRVEARRTVVTGPQRGGKLLRARRTEQRARHGSVRNALVEPAVAAAARIGLQCRAEQRGTPEGIEQIGHAGRGYAVIV